MRGAHGKDHAQKGDFAWTEALSELGRTWEDQRAGKAARKTGPRRVELFTPRSPKRLDVGGVSGHDRSDQLA